MKYFILCFVCVSNCLFSYAQQKNFVIKGRVIDSVSKEAIEYATVSVFQVGSGNVAGGMITASKGIFNIDGLSPGNYKVKVDFIGYKAKVIEPVVLGGKQTIADLGRIMLSGTTGSLKEVTVSGQRNMLENHIDKLVYNAEKDVTSQGGTATDVLKKVPQVSVDANGNVELLGSSNIKVLINGKPSPMFDNNLADALQTIPGSQIKSIEVISSPGAKYDAEGTGGIINIVLKENKSEGINGNVTLSAGTRLENGSASVHARKGAFDINFSIGSTAFLKSTTLNYLDKKTGNTELIQDGYGTQERTSYKPQLGINWAINKQNNLIATFTYNNYGTVNTGYTSQQYTSDLNPEIWSYRNSSDDFRNRLGNGSLDYDKKFDKKGEELSISLQADIANNSSHFGQGSYYNSNDTLFSGLKGDNSISDRESNISIDYVLPVKKSMDLELGGKGSFSRISSSSSYTTLNTNTQLYAEDPSERDKFNYNRDVYAAYASLSFPIASSVMAKAGIRDEYTNNSGNFSANRGISVPSYNSFIPSVTISYSLKKNQTLKISYSKRIQRPRYSDLNPYINASDPTNVTEGNPGLLPERTNFGMISYYRFFDKGGSLLINGFYRYTNDDEQKYIANIASLRVGDSVYTNVSVNTNMNVGIQQTLGCHIYGTIPITSKLELRANIGIFDKYILSKIEQGRTINGINYRANINATYQFSKGLLFEFFGDFHSARTEIQGNFPSFSTYSFAIRKLLFGKKASIAFTTTNPFNEYTDQKTDISGIGFSLQSNNRIPNRSFGLIFSYRFGKTEYKEKKEEHNDPNGDEG
jgi:hypothetical protein